jgi:hypothetical protein
MDPQSTSADDELQDYPAPENNPSGGNALLTGSAIAALAALLFI